MIPRLIFRNFSVSVNLSRRLKLQPLAKEKLQKLKIQQVPAEKQDWRYYLKHGGSSFVLAMFGVYIASVSFSCAVAFTGYGQNIIKSIENFEYGKQFVTYSRGKATNIVESAKTNQYLKDLKFLTTEFLENVLVAGIIFLCLKPIKMTLTPLLARQLLLRKQKKGVIDSAQYQMNKNLYKERAQQIKEKRWQQINSNSKIRNMVENSQRFKSKHADTFEKLRPLPKLRGRLRRKSLSQNKDPMPQNNQSGHNDSKK